MLLRQLKLQNIRSYLDASIDFPSGSILLSGDIGCGKSTLLLAIEFVLFGLSKPDLPGEALLRKGTTQGSVELSFSLPNQEIFIKRNLKKDKDSVKQTSGYIILNGMKKELTPVELKAEIFSLLGYPEELVGRNKNYIYHYTVYTQQEEMKRILQEDAEERQNVLRKIFNIDKYKNVRENVQFYLKQMRVKVAVMEAKLEPLTGQETRLEQLEQENVSLSISLTELSPKLDDSKRRLQFQQKELEQLESKQKKFQEAQLKRNTLSTQLNEKKEQLSQLSQQQEKLNQQLQDISISSDITLDSVKAELLGLQQRKDELFQKRVSLQEKSRSLQKQISELQQQLSLAVSQISLLEETRKTLAEMEEKIKQKEPLKAEKLALEHQAEILADQISKNFLLLNQSQELQKKILGLETCPTCLQPVTPEHKHDISTKEQEKIETVVVLLKELETKKIFLQEQRKQTLDQIEVLLRLENQAARIKTEIKHLLEKKTLLESQQETLKSKVQEYAQSEAELASLTAQDETPAIVQRITELQELQQRLNQKNYLGQQLKSVEAQLQKVSEQISSLNSAKSVVENELFSSSDCSEALIEQKKSLSLVLQEEKELSIKAAQISAALQGIQKQQQPLREQISILKEVSSNLIHYKELYHWLDEFFVPLTVTMEKQMMANVHHLFNQLFQEWFGMLIEDENVSSRLDDSFTPIIEQNGYELSFSNLSGGEKTSAALAYRLALNKVINDVISNIQTKELLILDEPTDGFSTEQLDKVRDVLDKLHLGQVIIVSHESKIETFVDNVIRVEKEGHISRIG